LRCTCYNGFVVTQEEIVSGTMTYIRERLGMTLVEEKLAQDRLGWFRHIEWRLPEALLCSEILSRTGNEKRGR
jgi:hypothetical protein